MTNFKDRVSSTLTYSVRWITGQKGTTVTMPRYAHHDLARAAGSAQAECAA